MRGLFGEFKKEKELLHSVKINYLKMVKGKRHI
jgi:hypothetical protein